MIANGGMLVQAAAFEVSLKESDEQIEKIEPPKQAIKPETAITMRRMMEHVVLNGTGKKARLDGYTSGGKTGSAQIFDTVAKVYTHKYNASFMGFAPVNNPAIVVVVTLNGASKYGGAVAAPVFREVAGAALRFLDVPRDLPDGPIGPVTDEEPAAIFARGTVAIRIEDEELKQAIDASARPCRRR